jgi:hypothetical protein
VRGALATAAVAALLAAGCGGDAADDSAEHGAVDTAIATAPEDQVVTVPETAPPVTVTAPAEVPTAPEEEQGGAGDEEGVRSTVRFVLGADGGVSPDSAQATAFFNVEVSVENRDSEAHRLEVGDRGAQLPAGRTTTLTLPGRAATELPVLVDGEQAAVLRVTAEATP